MALVTLVLGAALTWLIGHFFWRKNYDAKIEIQQGLEKNLLEANGKIDGLTAKASDLESKLNKSAEDLKAAQEKSAAGESELESANNKIAELEKELESLKSASGDATESPEEEAAEVEKA